MKKILLLVLLAGLSIMNVSALEENDYIFSLCQEVRDPGSYTLDPYFVIPGLGIFKKEGQNRFKSLDRERCTEFDEFIRMDDIYFDQILALDSMMIVRSGKSIWKITEKAESIERIDTNAFRLFAGHQNNCYAVTYENGNSTLYSIGLIPGSDSLPLVSTEGYILRVIPSAGGEDDLVFLSDGMLFLYSEKELKSLFRTDEPIIDFALVNKGILYLTSSGLFRYDGELNFAVSHKQYRQLLYDEGRTYIIGDNDHIYYSDIF